MTEAERLAELDPNALFGVVRRGASHRKLLLYCLLCCPRVEDEQNPRDPRRWLATEEFADGNFPLDQLQKMWGGSCGHVEHPDSWAWEFANYHADEERFERTNA